jgi:protocatechuate 3,4-dioxygenase, beta subunit
MKSSILQPQRRLFLAGCAAGVLGTSFWTVRGAFAEELVKTPAQTEGPFYPDKLPLDTDNDLIVVNESITPAVGTITHLSGRVLDAKGSPVRNALVEIWQCDSNGSYLHSKSDNKKKYDKNFQGFGRFLTGSKGEYYFRTIKPVPYPGRTPHIHFKIKQGRKDLLTTQLYVKGEKRNEKDGIWKSVKDPRARESITVGFKAIKDSKIGEVAASFDVVLGMTPSEEKQDEK